MTALKIARAALMTSIVFFAIVLGLGYAGLLSPEGGMLLGILAAAGMAVGSVACLIIQLFLQGRR